MSWSAVTYAYRQGLATPESPTRGENTSSECESSPQPLVLRDALVPAH
jgi:hypothetical protein